MIEVEIGSDSGKHCGSYGGGGGGVYDEVDVVGVKTFAGGAVT